MRIIELFAGIGSCSVALKRIGIDLEIVDAVEIDKYAMASFNAIHGTSFEVQDICEWDKDLKDIDIITHGSPCQDFSVAGKQAGGDKDSGTRSSLMYETIRIVDKIRPKYVLWENVKNILSKKHRHNFEAYLKAMEDMGYTNFYQVLNAKDYGIPQNRERVYTVSILGNGKYNFPDQEKLEKMPIEYLEENAEKKYDLTEKNKQNYERNFGSKGKQIDLFESIPTLTASMGNGGGNIPYFEFPPKEELKLKLKDMLETEVEEKYFLKDYQIENIKKSNFNASKTRIQTKDYCLTLCARDWKDPKCVQVRNLDVSRGSKRTNVIANLKMDKWQDHMKRIYDIDSYAPTIGTMQGGNTEPKILEYPIIAASRGRNPDNPSSRVAGEPTEQRLEVNKQRTTNCLSTVQKGNYVLENQYRIRKLTPKECWRLMGFSDEDFEKAQAIPTSNTQLYKQAGNSIVVNVLERIFENLFKEQK